MFGLLVDVRRVSYADEEGPTSRFSSVGAGS